MANELRLTVVGHLTADPELRFTPAGAAVAAFTVAHNERRFDREANIWKDYEASFVRVQAWRDLGEHLAQSLHRGDRVIVTGTLREERWETDAGDKRSTWRLTADAAGPDLTFATASVRRATRRDDTPPDDPWASASTESPDSEPAGE